MIRRLMGSQWLLIAQADHAHLAGALASHLGNTLFEAPTDAERFRTAVAEHDFGWISADEVSTRNAAGEPIDFREIDLAPALKIWDASAEYCNTIHPLCGLLVSLHSLALSILRADREPIDAAWRFAINKFQHRQIELQEECRRKLGLAGDVPLHHGLAENSDEPREQSIAHQFHLLQAMDALSLAICCTEPPVTQIKPVPARPGGRSFTLRLRKINDDTLHVSPWPFDLERFTVDVPAVRLPVAPVATDDALRKSVASAPRETRSMVFTASR